MRFGFTTLEDFEVDLVFKAVILSLYLEDFGNKVKFDLFLRKVKIRQPIELAERVTWQVKSKDSLMQQSELV